MTLEHFQVIIPPEQSKGGSLEKSLWFAFITVSAKNSVSVRPFVTSFSGHTSKARDLKIGMHISHMNGFKFPNQICDTLSKIWDISCFL